MHFNETQIVNITPSVERAINTSDSPLVVVSNDITQSGDFYMTIFYVMASLTIVAIVVFCVVLGFTLYTNRSVRFWLKGNLVANDTSRSVKYRSVNLKNNIESNEVIETLVEDINDEQIARRQEKEFELPFSDNLN